MTINIKVVTTTKGIPQLRNVTAAVFGPLWLLKDGPELVATLITLRLAILQHADGCCFELLL